MPDSEDTQKRDSSQPQRTDDGRERLGQMEEVRKGAKTYTPRPPDAPRPAPPPASTPQGSGNSSGSSDSSGSSGDSSS